jgi:polyhydroxybutyrate depolymerase
VALPAGVERPPVVVWLHGYGRSGAIEIANAAFVEGFTARGYALVAPTGQVDVLEGSELDWGVSDGAPMGRDDSAFLQDVIADAVARFGLAAGRVLVAGFSRGGSMAWDLACRQPDMALAFAAVAGALWQPLPEACAGPAHLHHTHGFTDRVLPFEGRDMVWYGVAFHPADVMASLARLRRAGGCAEQASVETVAGERWRKTWTNCANGASVTLLLWPGGHGLPAGWTDGVLDWFEAVAGD